MLGILRKKAGSVIFAALIALLVLSFAIWGIGDIFRGGGRFPPVAEVGGIEISGLQLNAAFRRQLEQVRLASNVDIDAEQARSLGLVDRALQQLILETLFTIEANRLGLAVSDRQVEERIRTDPAFQGRLGAFDPMLYDRILAMNGMSKADYEQAQRVEIAQDHLAGSLLAGNRVPDRLALLLDRYRGETRVAEIATVPFAEVTGFGSPSEADLAAFHEENSFRFMAPEYRSFVVVHLDPAELAREIAISTEEVREEYEARIDEFTVRETRRIRQILFEDEKTAGTAYSSLRAGASFDEAAKNSEDGRVTELGFVTEEEVLPEVGKVAFGLQAGAFSEPFESPFGWHVIEVAEIRAGRTRSPSEASEQLHSEIASRKGIEAATSLANRLDDELAGGATIEEAAKRLNLKWIRVEKVDRQGRNITGGPHPGLPNLPGLLATVFDTPVNAESLLKETPDGGTYVLRVDESVPSRLRPLSEVREEVRAAWEEQARERVAKAEAEALLGRVRSGNAFSAVARERGVSLRTTPPATRAEGVTAMGVPAPLAETIFRLKAGEAAMGRTDGGYAVVRVAKVDRPEPAKAGDRQADGEGALAKQLAEDLLIQYGQALEGRYGVEVHESAVERLF